MERSQPFALAVPVNHTDHVIEPASAKVTLVEYGDVYLQRVHEHIDGGAKSGVRSTPGFFVNGAVQDVSFGLERLYEAVEAGLRR